MPGDRWARRLTCRRGWTPGAVSGREAAGLQAGHPFRPDATSLGDGARGLEGLGAATDPVGEGVCHAFLVENCTYLLIDLPRAGALVKDFFALFSLLKPGPPGKAPPAPLRPAETRSTFWAAIYGAPRLGQSSVQSAAADRNFQVYVRRRTCAALTR